MASPIERTTARARANTHQLPADLIFSPRELKYYQRWQHQITTFKPAEVGCLPTAFEYYDFQQWLVQRDSGYFSDNFEDIAAHMQQALTLGSHVPVAKACGHLLHPSQLTSPEKCPVCLIDTHMKYMNSIEQALDKLGGRIRTRLEQAKTHELAFEAWQYGKLCMVADLLRLEHCAQKEKKWERTHVGYQMEDSKTAEQALDMYWESLGGKQSATKECQPMSPKKNKNVAFAEETNFEPGRPQPYFRRGSPRYEAGKYEVAVADDEDEEESNDAKQIDEGASLKNNMSEEAENQDDEDDQEIDDDESIDSDSDDDDDCSSVDSDDIGDIVFENDEAGFIVFEDD